MSDILIRGMEMPKDIEPGLVIEFADGIDGKRYARLYHYRHGGLTEWLEAIHIPPHGDLIERDKLREKEFIHDGDAYAVVMSRDIRNAPTIIPAEPSEEQREYEAQVEASQYCEMYEPTYDPETGAL